MVLSNLSFSLSYAHRGYLPNQMAEEGSDLKQGIFLLPTQDREQSDPAEGSVQRACSVISDSTLWLVLGNTGLLAP